MNADEKHIPRGWICEPLGNVITPRGEKVSPIDHPDYDFIGMDHVEANTMRILGSVPATQMKSSAARFYAGDVLYGRLRPYLNKVTRPTFDGLASAEFIVFPDSDFVKSSFLKYRLNTADFVSFASHLNEGDRPRVSFDQIGVFDMLVPPPAEQGRIVVKIEELLSELDRGVESLNTAREQLKIYRQALFNHAFEGKLTAHWREKHKNRLVDAEQLLASIRTKREARYQQQIVEWKTAIEKCESKGRKDKKPSKPRPPKALSKLSDDVRGTLTDLPDYWEWDKLGWMTCGVEYGTAAKSSEVGLVPVIRMGNLQNGTLDWDDLVFTSDKEEIKKYSLNSGDVLFNRTNSPELVGKTAIYRGERPALFAGYLIRINQIGAIADNQYVNLFLNSHVARQHGNTVKTDGVNQSNINGEKLQSYPFPYCSLAEQCEVVRILDEKLSLADQLMQEIDAQLMKSNALRQSILKKAFSGRLVAQDPKDEPASVLLERIKTGKTEQDKGNKKNKMRNAA